MTVYQADLRRAKDFLLHLIKKSAPTQATEWLSQKLEQLSGSEIDKNFYLAFSAAPRFVGKNTLTLDNEDLQQANGIREGFNPSTWTTAQAARTLLVLSLPHDDPEAFAASIEKLFSTADMGELVALYGSLPLLPHPEQFRLRAAEGVRTNMGDVFEAIALNNPYPADYLKEGAWNQLVLKTVFVGKPLYKIYGLEKRSNPTLARILSDYAHERWAAGRTVTPELWRPIGPFIDDRIIEDIKKLFSDSNEIQHEAAALACSQGNFIPAKELLEAHPILKSRIETGEINWNAIGSKSLN